MKSTLILTVLTFFFINTVSAQKNLKLSPSRTKTTNNSLIITSEGNVGIGKANPKNKLEVNGRIHAKSVKVDLDNWADFVFEESYTLPSLSETEAYIDKNGHLEGIPSAETVIEEGIDLGEMNVKLLQKIEELTLYLIEKDKQVNMLSTKLEALSERVSEIEK